MMSLPSLSTTHLDKHGRNNQEKYNKIMHCTGNDQLENIGSSINKDKTMGINQNCPQEN